MSKQFERPAGASQSDRTEHISWLTKAEVADLRRRSKESIDYAVAYFRAHCQDELDDLERVNRRTEDSDCDGSSRET